MLLLALEKGEAGRSYNIVGENERRNIDLVRTICGILDAKRPESDSAYGDQGSSSSARAATCARSSKGPRFLLRTMRSPDCIS